jgi:hypothetical protein
MIAMCIFMMVFMMGGCMRRIKHMMAGYKAESGEARLGMAHCPCMAMMGRFMKNAETKNNKTGAYLTAILSLALGAGSLLGFLSHLPW